MSFTFHDDDVSAAREVVEDAKQDFVDKLSAAWTAIGLNVDEDLLLMEISDVITATYVRLHDRRMEEITRLKRGVRRR